MFKQLVTVLALGGLVLTTSVRAETANDATVAKIKTELKALFGGEEPDSVKPSAVDGMYQVTLGTDVIYITEDTQYIFYGNLIDRKNRIDLTRQAKEDAEKAFSVKRKAIMDKQDAAKTISFKAKDEKQVLNVFTDIDCPYCAKLHKEVPTLNDKGVTVNYYLFPRSPKGSPSYKKAVSAWCADNQQDALTKAKNRESIPSKSCDNPIDQQHQLGQEIGVTGTPALVTQDGTLLPGYMPANVLLSRLGLDK